MSSGMREIRHRIKSVKSTQQITKAMKMVSVSKLRKSQRALEIMRPYAQKYEEVLGTMLGMDHRYHSPYIGHRPEIKKVCYVLFTGNRGLCGGYNSNVSRFMEHLLEEEEKEWIVVVCGRWGRDNLHRSGIPVLQSFTDLGDNPSIAQGVALSEYLQSLYLSGQVDKVYLVYQRFLSTMVQQPVSVRLLPAWVEDEYYHESSTEYLFEPGEKEFLAQLMPHYITSVVYEAMLEAKAGEHGARMTAMSAATDNTNSMIGGLTLSLNRARQAAITTEISEIVSGAAALEK